mmetsp:Transcript_11810/g.28638  ORF Transcript_11810/g.28638 Transcript_11810/m.28638 type:complete len:246 (+) Transcript_11810:878-1615(+)
MCCSLLTISSDSPKPVLRCLPFLDVFPPLSVTSPLLPQIWVVCKNVLPPPPRDPLPPYKPFTCLLMILQILLPPQLLLTWMPPLCFLVPLLSWVSTPLSIPLTPRLGCLIPVSLDKHTTKLPVPPKSFSKITRACKTLLLFLVWMNCRKMISSLSPVPVRSKSSCPNLSTSLKFSPVPRASLFLWTTPSKDSRKSLQETTMTCRRVLSTWLETLTMSRRRPPVWPSRVARIPPWNQRARRNPQYF